MNILPALLAATIAHASGDAPARETWSKPALAGELLDAIKILSAQRHELPGRASAPQNCPSPTKGDKDEPGDSENCLVQDAFACGVLGERCADRESTVPTPVAFDVSPLSTGFVALGPAGTTGKIDGPGSQGNGAYRVDKNDPYEVALTLDTGYIKGQATLKRDPLTGKDSIRFAGKVWENGKLSEHRDNTHDAVISYKSKDDAGTIRWTENSGKKAEDFWGGKSGRSMTIEFGGGYDHDFQQD